MVSRVVRTVLIASFAAALFACSDTGISDRLTGITLSPSTIPLTYSTSAGTADSATITPSVEPSTVDETAVTWSWTSTAPATVSVVGVLTGGSSGLLIGAVVTPASPYAAGTADVSLTATLADGSIITSNPVTVTVTATP